MDNFDLRQALVGSPELSDKGCGSCCFNMTELQEQVYSLSDGLELVLSHGPIAAQKVATLLLAVNKMKRSLTRRQLRGDDLCSTIMEGLVEETLVKTTKNSAAVRCFMRRMSSTDMCTLCDTSDKDVVQESKLKLQATTLGGGHGEQKAQLKILKYSTNSPGAGEPVVLSICDKDLHFSCSMNGSNAELILEECCETKLRWIDGDMNRFLFYNRTTGMSVNTFESVKCPGWFISTCRDERQTVDMCSVDNQARLTTFKKHLS